MNLSNSHQNCSLKKWWYKNVFQITLQKMKNIKQRISFKMGYHTSNCHRFTGLQSAAETYDDLHGLFPVLPVGLVFFLLLSGKIKADSDSFLKHNPNWAGLLYNIHILQLVQFQLVSSISSKHSYSSIFIIKMGS